MRAASALFLGALAAASCLVPNYELVGSFDDGGEDVAGGAGESSGGTSSGQGGSGTGGTAGSGTSGKGGSGTGGSATGGSAGTAGSAGMAGSAGTAGCATDLTDCDGDCVNTQTDGSHCGDCETECTGGLVCLNGSCENDCGDLDECGTSCVNVLTDEAHCGACNQPCLGECINGQCDLSCPNGRLRCGALCCDIPPAHAVATCAANTCGVECEDNYQGCGSAPLECFANNVTHCGPNCIDCTQPNATAACVDTNSNGENDACRNTCAGYTFACGGVMPGKPSCGSWDFESQTTEGWSIWNNGETDLRAGQSAYNGNFMTRTSFRTSGMFAMSADFDGDGANRFGIQFKIGLCGNGQAIDLRARRLTFDVRAVTQSGYTPFEWVNSASYFLTYNGSSQVPFSPGNDFNMAAEEWVTAIAEYPNGTDDMTATDIVFWFRVFVPWRGTVFIDNMRFE